MKRHLTILMGLLLSYFNLSAYQSESLTYELKTGEEFYYRIQSIASTDTAYSSRVWLRFRVLQAHEKHYEMSMQYVRFYEKQFYKTVDSNDYFPGAAKDIMDIINKIAIEKPILFHLSKQGGVTGLHFSEELNEAIQTNVLGITNKHRVKKLSIVSDERLKTTISSVFPVLSPGKQKWSVRRPATEIYPEYTIGYEHIATTENDYIINSSVLYENSDSTNFSSGSVLQMRVDLIKQKGAIILNKSNGLLSRSEITSGVRIMRRLVQDKLQELPIETENTMFIERLDKVQFGVPTYISGTLPKTGWKEMAISIWPDFPDHELLDVKITPEVNEFSAQFLLPRATEAMMIGETDTNSPGNFGGILIEPGDSIHVELSWDDRPVFKGKGATKNQVWHDIQQLGLFLSQDMKWAEVVEIFGKNIEERTQLLNAAAPDLSDWAYEHLKADIYFREYRNRYNYYLGNTDQGPDLALFKKLFGDLDLKTYNTSQSFSFRWFARDYLRARANLFHNFDRESLIPSNGLYTLAGWLLDGKQEYFIKAQLIFDLLKLGNPKDYEPMYRDFMSTYPGSPFIKVLKDAYDRRGNVYLGKQAPDFALSDMNGELFRLSQKRGKWVMLVFYNLNDEFKEDDLIKFSKLANQFPESDLELVVVFTNKNTEKTSAYLKAHNGEKENKYRATFLNNAGWSNLETLPYMLPLIPSNYLINPDGYIEFMGGLSSSEIYPFEFEEYIRQDMFTRNQLKGESDNYPTLWIVLIAIAVVLTIWFYFVWKTKRLKRMEQAKLERVEMEIRAVRSQLNPHFLFNAMSSIQHLVNT